ncbi:MAG: preprotein translocase subunit YajC [Actinomycetota bacterium]
MTFDFLLFAVLLLLIVLLIMQNRRRRKEIEVMQKTLAVGAEVILHAGIKGKVVSLTDDEVEIESAGSKLRVLRGAVGKVVSAGEK